MDPIEQLRYSEPMDGYSEPNFLKEVESFLNNEETPRCNNVEELK